MKYLVKKQIQKDQKKISEIVSSYCDIGTKYFVEFFKTHSKMQYANVMCMQLEMVTVPFI